VARTIVEMPGSWDLSASDTTAAGASFWGTPTAAVKYALLPSTAYSGN